MKRIFAPTAVFCLLFLSWKVFGGDVPPVTPADFAAAPATVPEAGWLYQLLAGSLSTAILGGLAWLAWFIDSWLRERTAIKSHAALEAAYNFAAYGVDYTWKILVSALKDAKADDGKLTEEEKRQAMAMAKGAAVDYARKNGVDLLKSLGPELLELLIEKVIGNRKAGQFIIAPLPALPDLLPSGS